MRIFTGTFEKFLQAKFLSSLETFDRIVVILVFSFCIMHIGGGGGGGGSVFSISKSMFENDQLTTKEITV